MIIERFIFVALGVCTGKFATAVILKPVRAGTFVWVAHSAPTAAKREANRAGRWRLIGWGGDELVNPSAPSFDGAGVQAGLLLTKACWTQ